MRVTENGFRIQLLGDPHLGRSFVNGVPLHRRGDREKLVRQAFLDALTPGHDVDYHICLGDLFDKWIVSFDLILDTAEAYRSAAHRHPGTIFYILKGNHDWIRDLERRSAFDVFAALVADIPNIRIVDKPQFIKAASIALMPWHPLLTADEMASQFPEATVLFCHCDTEFSDRNMVPTKLHYERIYTGHIHKPDRFTREGTEVVVVGSLQPYAHGEEPDDSLYITVRAEDITDTSIFKDKCLRILGQYEGDPIDCLAIVYKQEATDDDDNGLESVTLGDFDMDKLFAEAFAEAGVSADRTAQVLEQYQTKRNVDGI